MNEAEKSHVNKSILYQLFTLYRNMLQTTQKFKLLSYIFFQLLASALDILAALVIGIYAFKLTSADSSSIASVLALLPKSELILELSETSLLSLAGVLFILKNLFQIYFLKKLLEFLPTLSSRFSVNYFQKIVDSPRAAKKVKDSGPIIFSMNLSSEYLFIDALASLVILISELSLVLIFFIFLLWVNPVTTLICFLILSTAAIIIYKGISLKQSHLSNIRNQSQIESNRSVEQALESYREISLSVYRESFTRDYKAKRNLFSRSHGRMMLAGLLPKNYFELISILGLAFIIIINRVISSDNTAPVKIALFLAIFARIMPSLLRIQSSLSMLKSASGYLSPLSSLKVFEENKQETKIISRNSQAQKATPILSFKEAAFSFPNSSGNLINPFNLDLFLGDFVILSGASGSGKSTFLDLCCGAEILTGGTVQINLAQNKDQYKKDSQVIGYLPQNPYILHGTLLENIALGVDESKVDVTRVKNLLRLVYLHKLVEYFETFGNFHIQNRIELSGGEKQRLALARLLYSNPSIMLLDEFTSAMEKDLEREILLNFKKITQNKLVITSAHRTAVSEFANRQIIISNHSLIETTLLR